MALCYMHVACMSDNYLALCHMHVACRSDNDLALCYMHVACRSDNDVANDFTELNGAYSQVNSRLIIRFSLYFL